MIAFLTLVLGEYDSLKTGYMDGVKSKAVSLGSEDVNLGGPKVRK